jgi:hypothetical protein
VRAALLKSPYELAKYALPVALARGFAAELAIEHGLEPDPHQDAHHLHLKRAAEEGGELSEDALPLALARSFTPDLSRDHRHDTNDLRLRGKPVRIEVVGRPGKIFVNTVEAEPEEMLSLLCGAPPIPAGRLAGASDGWQARDGYDVAVPINGVGLSQLRIGALGIGGIQT